MTECKSGDDTNIGFVVCDNNAEWQGLCSRHGGTHPTTPELMTLLSQLTGWVDQTLSVSMSFKRQRVYYAQDAHPDDRTWGFTVSVKILGQAYMTGAQGETLETALWSLCEAVMAKISDIGHRHIEDAVKAQDAMAKFVAQHTGAVDRDPIGPYR